MITNKIRINIFKIRDSRFKVLFLVIFGLLCFNLADAVTLYSGAANQTIYEDQTFAVDWFLDTQGQPINTIFLKMNYNPDVLEVVSAQAGGSAFNLWVQTPEFDNAIGTLELTGGISGGAKSNKIPVFTATFKPKTTGATKIIMDESSTILLADGEGTSTKLLFNQLNFSVHPSNARPVSISSPTHPVEAGWYKDNKVVIKVETKPEESYSYSFSSNLEIIPNDTADEIKGELVFEDLPDGVYYFKLNSKLGTSNWQEAGVFRVQIDATPPEGFTPTIGSDAAVFEGDPFLSFATTDNVSGIVRYEIKIGPFGKWQQIDGTYFRLPGLVLGDTIEVKVVDAAGNEQIRTVKVSEYGGKSIFKSGFLWSILIVALILIYPVVRLAKRLVKHYNIQ